MKLGVNGRFYGAPVTGVQRYAREVVERLCALADVTLFLPAGVEAEPLPRPARVVRGRLPGVLWEQLELPLQAKRLGHVILHPANASPFWGRTPRVVVLHDVLPLSHPELYSRSYRGWTRVGHLPGARRAQVLATVSAWSAGEIARVLGVERSRIVVTGQGAAPLDRPADPASVEEVLSGLGIRRPYFLALDGAPRKGLDLLLEVWTDPEPPAAALVVVGRGGDRKGRGPQAPGVHLVGAVTDETLRALYTGARAFLFPSVAEGFGRPPLEALACGTRVAVSPYPASEALGDAVLRVPREAGAWRGAVEDLLGEADERRACAVERGRALAGTWSWDSAVATLLDLCRRVAAS